MNVAISEAATLAIHALAHLAKSPDSSPVSTASVAKQFGFSEAHLSKVFQRLTKVGFVKSVRGPQGGFVLADDPATISLLAIYEAIDGPLSRHKQCLLEKPDCEFNKCLFGDLLESIPDQIDAHLSGTTLADFAEAPKSS